MVRPYVVCASAGWHHVEEEEAREYKQEGGRGELQLGSGLGGIAEGRSVAAAGELEHSC